MTAIPPVGAGMPPVVSEAAPAAAGAPAAGDQLQDVFEGLNFQELQSQFFSGPELLGAEGAQGSATLRDFLGRLKDSDRLKKGGVEKKQKSDPLGEEIEAPLHGGPAREPFGNSGSPRDKVAGLIEELKRKDQEFLEVKRFLNEELYVTSLVAGFTKAFSELTKGQ